MRRLRLDALPLVVMLGSAAAACTSKTDRGSTRASTPSPAAAAPASAPQTANAERADASSARTEEPEDKEDPSVEEEETTTIIPPEVVSGAYLVPIGALGGGFLSDVLGKLPKPPLSRDIKPAVEIGKAKQPRTYRALAELDTYGTPGVLDYYLVEPAYMARTQSTLSGLRDFLLMAFGKEGLFDRQSIELPPEHGATGRHYRLPIGTNFLFDKLELATVRVEEGAPLPYVIEFYRQSRLPPYSEMERIVRLNFAVVGKERDAVVVHIEWRYLDTEIDPTSQRETVWLNSLDYDSRKAAIDLSSGYPSERPERAQKYLLHFEFENGYGRYFSAWQGDDAFLTGVIPELPRPLQGAGGDLVLTRAVSQLGVSEQVLYDQAYIAYEQRASIGSSPGPEIWSKYDAGTMLQGAFVEELRGPKLTGGCERFGDVLRAAVTAAGEPLPESVTKLPADVCASNRALSDKTLVSALVDACLLDSWPRVDFTLIGAEEPLARNACLDTYAALILRGHQFGAVTRVIENDEEINESNSRFYNDSPGELRDRRPLTPTYAALAPILESFHKVDLSIFDQPLRLDNDVPDLSAFADAETLGGVIAVEPTP